MPTIQTLLAQGIDLVPSDEFTLTDKDDTARLVLTGGQIDLRGFIAIEIKVGPGENDWSVFHKMEAPMWRAMDLPGPGTFRVGRKKDSVNARYPLGMVRILPD